MPIPLMSSASVPRFRKFKFGIVLQLTLLMIVLVFPAIWAISSWTSDSARDVVIDHEKIDLMEETQLSGWRLLDQIDALRYDLRQAAIVLHDRLSKHGGEIDAETAAAALPQRMQNRYLWIEMFKTGNAREIPPALLERCEAVRAAEPGQQWNSRETIQKRFDFTPDQSLVLIHNCYREKIKLKPEAHKSRQELGNSGDDHGPHVADTEYHVLWAGIFFRPPNHEREGNLAQPGGWWLLAGLGMDDSFRKIGGSPRHLGLLSGEQAEGAEPTLYLYSAAQSSLADRAGRFVRPLQELQPLFADIEAGRRLADFQAREHTNDRLEIAGPDLLELRLKPEHTMYFGETEKLEFAEPVDVNRARAARILEQLNAEFTEQEWQPEAVDHLVFRRVSDLGEVIPRIRLMSVSVEELKRLKLEIQQRFAGQVELTEPLGWRTEPVACRTCLVSQVRILLAPESQRLEKGDLLPEHQQLLSDSLHRLTLTLLVFEEELAADLDPELTEVKTEANIGGALAVLAAFCLSLLITRPLKAMIAASQTIADVVSQSQPSPLPLESHVQKLPLRRPDEIGDLAVAFRHLVHQVQLNATELQERESFLRGIHDNAMDGIMSIDARGIVLSFNPAAERIFGWTAAEVTGQHFEELYPSRVAEELRTSLSRYLTTGETRLMGRHSEVAGLRKDGSTFPLELSISQITQADGELIFVALLRDLCERKEAEKARDLMVSNEEKSHALREIAHEMLGDLTAIIGAADMFQRRFGSSLSPDQYEYLHRIHRSGHSLVDFLNNLRELARITSGSLSLQPESFSPREVIEDVLNILHPRCQSLEHRVYTELDELPVTLRADKRRVRQVIHNLLDNACKYTPAGGTIRLRGGVEDGQFTFEVSDNGIGIPDEDFDKVLRDFGRASNADAQAQGTGLGLGVCRRVLELHGGSLSFESWLHQGSTFRASLPLTPPVHHPDERVGDWMEQSLRPQPLRILVADARPEQSADLVEFLQEDGHTVDLVIDGEHLLSRARDWQPNVVLTVMKLPDMTARDLIHHLHDSGESVLPVILMSLARIPDVQAMGFVGLLSLPFCHADVRKLLQERAAVPLA